MYLVKTFLSITLSLTPSDFFFSEKDSFGEECGCVPVWGGRGCVSYSDGVKTVESSGVTEGDTRSGRTCQKPNGPLVTKG
jgi:hypothetical protein